MEARRQLCHPVAMAHPDLGLVAGLGHALEKLGMFGQVHEGPAELAVVAALGLHGQVGRLGFWAVADDGARIDPLAFAQTVTTLSHDADTAPVAGAVLE